MKDNEFDMEYEVSKVYDYVTGSRLSKPTYWADTVIEVHNDHLYEMNKILLGDLAEDIETIFGDGRGNMKDVIEFIKDYI